MNKKIVLTALKVMVSIFLLIGLTVVLFSGALYVGMRAYLCNPDKYISAAEKAQNDKGFFDGMYERACQTLVRQGTLSGLPETVFTGLLTKEYVTDSFRGYVNSVVEGTASDYRLTEFDYKLRKAVNSWLESDEALKEGITATESEIDDFVDYIDAEIVNDVSLPFFRDLYPYIEAVYSDTLKPFIIVAIIAAAVIIFGLLLLPERGNFLNSLRQWLYALTASGFLLIALAVFLYLLDGNSYFSFSTQSVLDYLNVYKSQTASLINIIGCIVSVTGIAATVLIMYFTKERKKPESVSAE